MLVRLKILERFQLSVVRSLRTSNQVFNFLFNFNIYFNDSNMYRKPTGLLNRVIQRYYCVSLNVLTLR